MIISIVSFMLIKKETIAIIGAMDVEIEEISANLSNVNYKEQNDFKIIIGNLGKYRIILSNSGVGKRCNSSKC